MEVPKCCKVFFMLLTYPKGREHFVFNLHFSACSTVCPSVHSRFVRRRMDGRKGWIYFHHQNNTPDLRFSNRMLLRTQPLFYQKVLLSLFLDLSCGFTLWVPASLIREGLSRGSVQYHVGESDNVPFLVQAFSSRIFTCHVMSLPSSWEACSQVTDVPLALARENTKRI